MAICPILRASLFAHHPSVTYTVHAIIALDPFCALCSRYLHVYAYM